MLQLVLLFVGVLAFATSFLTVTRQLDERLWSLFAMILWGVFGFGAFDIEVVSQGGIVSQPHLSVVFVGAAGALIMLLFFIEAITGALAPTEETRYANSR